MHKEPPMAEATTDSNPSPAEILAGDDASTELTFIPVGKLRCIITDKLRNDTAEEHVRQRVARSLITDYGYKREDIEVEYRINIGVRRPRVDIAIFPPNVTHKQEHISILIECKKDDIKPSDKDNGVEQLKSYMSACLNSRYGMWVGSELQAWERISTVQGVQDFLEASDIPRFGADAPQPPRFTDLVPAEIDLVAVFRRCHNYIYGNQGLQKEPAFNELLKVIFCKVQDEGNLSDTLRFFIGNEERRSRLGQGRLRNTIEQLYSEVRHRYPYIFGSDETIRLTDQVLAYVVGELQRYSLIRTRADVKGIAYEQLVGSNLRGDRGEFFTPRTVCKMAAEMVLATFPPERWLSIRVLDPAVGTGGFLVALMNVWNDHIRQLEQARWREDDSQVDHETRNRLRDLASRQLFGIDFNPTLARAAQMNLVMHGDGSTNVFHENSLLPPGEWSREEKNNVAASISFGQFDAILTNPPFGDNIRIDDPHILAQFQLSKVGSDTLRSAIPPDQLFIERSLQLLRPGGRLAIVLPDSILSNPGLVGTREWILKNARVIASIDLPQETFEPHTGTQTSVLLLQKKTNEEIAFEKESGHLREYEIFMAVPRAVGHDRRGNPLPRRTLQGHIIEDKEVEHIFRRDLSGKIVGETLTRRVPAIHDELPSIVESFRTWVSSPSRIEWLNG